MAKLAESRALEAVKMPANASPEEKKAFAAAKMKILAKQTGANANYANKIKNVETKLLNAKEKARRSTAKMAKLTKQKNKLRGKMAAEKDGMVKAKLKTKIRAIDGAIKAEKASVKKAKAGMAKESKKQQKEIANVVKGVVLSNDPVNKAQNAADAKSAKAAKK